MQQQIQEGIIEEAPPKPIGEVLHYVHIIQLYAKKPNRQSYALYTTVQLKETVTNYQSTIAQKLTLRFNLYCLTSCCATE